jgi:hypothetical protein
MTCRREWLLSDIGKEFEYVGFPGSNDAPMRAVLHRINPMYPRTGYDVNGAVMSRHERTLTAASAALAAHELADALAEANARAAAHESRRAAVEAENAALVKQVLRLETNVKLLDESRHAELQHRAARIRAQRRELARLNAKVQHDAAALSEARLRLIVVAHGLSPTPAPTPAQVESDAALARLGFDSAENVANHLVESGAFVANTPAAVTILEQWEREIRVDERRKASRG